MPKGRARHRFAIIGLAVLTPALVVIGLQRYLYNGPPAMVAIITPSADDMATFQAAADQAAGRYRIPTASWTVDKVETVQWGDTSLGCPQPNVSYLPVLVPGYRFWLKAGSVRLEFHSAFGGALVACANPVAPAGRRP